MKQTYWNRQGKHQDWVDKTDEMMPNMYYTDNKYMNVFIAMNNIYYDIYNNGGGNIKDGCYKDALKIIHGFIGKFNSRTAIKNYDYLEDKTNEIFEKLMQEDLSFVNHGFWSDGAHNKISMDKQTGEGWRYITCGTKDNAEREFGLRKRFGYEVV